MEVAGSRGATGCGAAPQQRCHRRARVHPAEVQAVTPRPGGTSSRRPLWPGKHLPQHRARAAHCTTWQSVLCAHGCERPAEGSARVPHWVPVRARARARERTPLTHSLSTRPRRSPQRHHAHSSPTSRARRRRAPRTEHGASARLRGASRRRELQRLAVSAADPASAASPTPKKALWRGAAKAGGKKKIWPLIKSVAWPPRCAKVRRGPHPAPRGGTVT